MDLNRPWDRLPQNSFFFLVRHLVEQYFDHKVNRSAAAMTYYLVFSFFPLITLGSSILSFLQLPPDFTAGQVQGILPPQVVDIVSSFLGHVNQTPSGGLFAFSLIFSLYSPMRAADYLLECIGVAYNTENHRSAWKHTLIVVLFTISLPIMLLVSLVVLVMGENLLTFLSLHLPIAEHQISLWVNRRFLYLAAIIFAVLCALYWLGPGIRPRVRHVLPGAAAAMVALLAISMGLSYYVENIGNYSVVYGSLGAIMVLLLWLYLSSMALIMGAEFNRALGKLRGERVWAREKREQPPAPPTKGDFDE